CAALAQSRYFRRRIQRRKVEEPPRYAATRLRCPPRGLPRLGSGPAAGRAPTLRHYAASLPPREGCPALGAARRQGGFPRQNLFLPAKTTNAGAGWLT